MKRVAFAFGSPENSEIWFFSQNVNSPRLTDEGCSKAFLKRFPVLISRFGRRFRLYYLWCPSIIRTRHSPLCWWPNRLASLRRRWIFCIWCIGDQILRQHPEQENHRDSHSDSHADQRPFMAFLLLFQICVRSGHVSSFR